MIWRVYAKKSKIITFSHRITSLIESAITQNQNHTELYQTGSYSHRDFLLQLVRNWLQLVYSCLMFFIYIFHVF